MLKDDIKHAIIGGFLLTVAGAFIYFMANLVYVADMSNLCAKKFGNSIPPNHLIKYNPETGKCEINPSQYGSLELAE